MMGGVMEVALGRVGMVCGGLVIARFIMPGGLAVMPSGVLVMLGCLMMVLGCFLGHVVLLLTWKLGWRVVDCAHAHYQRVSKV
jgi:hypothetical protein